MTYLESLQNEIHMLRLILDNSFGNVFVSDANGQIVYSNYGAAAIMGLTPQQACQKTLQQLKDERLADNPASLQVLETHQETIQTVTYATGDSLAINAKPIFDEKGNLIYVIAISHNISMLGRYMDSIRMKTKLYWKALDYIQNENIPSNDIVAKSVAMKSLMADVNRATELDTPVIIYGENGSGKQSLAKELYRKGKRSNQIFLSYNCTSSSESNAEEELFGLDLGRESKDFSDKPGILEIANNGTVLLEEIGNLSLPLQAKLLSAIETGGFKHIGSSKVIHSNFQIIATTNRNLKEMVIRHEFNSDLFYRINVFPITIPPLRERVEDIETLASGFLNELNQKYNDNKKLDRKALEVLRMYSWPGNVRELKSTIERLFAVSNDNEISNSNVQSILSYAGGTNTFEKQHYDESLFANKDLRTATNEFQKRYILDTMKKTNGNATKAAELLSISRAGLYKKINELELKGKSLWEE